MSVKRYTFGYVSSGDDRYLGCIEKTDGPYVLYHDYSALEAEAAELRKRVDEVQGQRDTWRALADEAVYVGCMIGLDCASALADLQERGAYTPQCNDGKPSRANARRDAEKIADIYQCGVTLLRNAESMERQRPPSPNRSRTMSSEVKGVLAIMRLAESAVRAWTSKVVYKGGPDGFVQTSTDHGLSEAREIIAELIAADVEYDEALAEFNNTSATRPDWVQFHARFESARTRRDAALKAAQGGE